MVLKDDGQRKAFALSLPCLSPYPYSPLSLHTYSSFFSFFGDRKGFPGDYFPFLGAGLLLLFSSLSLSPSLEDLDTFPSLGGGLGSGGPSFTLRFLSSFSSPSLLFSACILFAHIPPDWSDLRPLHSLLFSPLPLYLFSTCLYFLLLFAFACLLYHLPFLCSFLLSWVSLPLLPHTAYGQGTAYHLSLGT